MPKRRSKKRKKRPAVILRTVQTRVKAHTRRVRKYVRRR